MLAINPSPSSKHLTPNILPCSIKHSGPMKISKRYWSPSTASNSSSSNSSTSYLRGRKLLSRTLKLPSGYQGIVLQKTDKPLPQKPPTAAELRRLEEDDDEMDMERIPEKPVDVKVMEQKAVFDEIMVWGHEAVPDAVDVYVKGVEEWIGFAEAMHSYKQPNNRNTSTTSTATTS